VPDRHALSIWKLDAISRRLVDKRSGTQTTTLIFARAFLFFLFVIIVLDLTISLVTKILSKPVVISLVPITIVRKYKSFNNNPISSLWDVSWEQPGVHWGFCELSLVSRLHLRLPQLSDESKD
jgi:hypothetical protein